MTTPRKIKITFEVELDKVMIGDDEYITRTNRQETWFQACETELLHEPLLFIGKELKLVKVEEQS